MIRVLHMGAALIVGGAERVLLDIAYYLDPELFQSMVLVFQGGPLEKEYQWRKIPYRILKKNRHLDLPLLFKLMAILRKHRIDLIHCHGVLPTVYGGMAARLLGIPQVVTVHGRNFFSVRSGLYGLRFAQKMRACIVTVSPELHDSLIREVGLRPEKMITITNGIPIVANRTVSAKALHCKRQEINLLDGPVIGTIGGLRKVKGQEYLIRCVPDLRAKYPNLQVVLIGDGELWNDLHNLVLRLGVQKNVRFCGERYDVLELLPSFDLVVQPSLTEGISIVILEAMAAGRAVIASDVGGNSTLIVDQESGLLVPPANVSVLTESILTLLDAPQYRNALGQAARQRVCQKFSIQRTLDQYQELYLNITKGKDRSCRH